MVFPLDTERLLQELANLPLDEVRCIENAYWRAAQTARERSERAKQRELGVWVLLWIPWFMFVVGAIRFWLDVFNGPEHIGWLGYDWAFTARHLLGLTVFVLTSYLMGESVPVQRFVNAVAGNARRWSDLAQAHADAAQDIMALREERLCHQ